MCSDKQARRWKRPSEGLGDGDADHFCYAVERYIDFVYEYENATMFTVEKEIIQEFVTLFWIRKNNPDSYVLSVMPKALELFYVYLKEKGLVDDIDTFIQAIGDSRSEFFANLKAFFTPAD